MNTLTLTADKWQTITTALRVAATVYENDAKTNAIAALPRLVEQFTRQAADARQLADFIENEGENPNDRESARRDRMPTFERRPAQVASQATIDRFAYTVYCWQCKQNYTQTRSAVDYRAPHCCGACGSRDISVTGCEVAR